MSAPIAGLVLDLDGTIHDHDGAAAAGLAQWLGEHRIAPSAELAREWRRVEHEWFARWERGELGFAAMRRGRIREYLPLLGLPAPVDDAAADAEFGRYLDAYRRHWRPYPDVPAFVDGVRALGVPTAVLSNGTDATQRAKLDAIGVGDRLGPLITAESAGAPKPDPRTYAAACAALDLPPELVLHVGDRHDLDVVAARANGMRAVHLDRAGTGPEPDAAGSLLDVLPLLAAGREGAPVA